MAKDLFLYTRFLKGWSESTALVSGAVSTIRFSSELGRGWKATKLKPSDITAPINSVPPAISGTYRAGSTLSATSGTWDRTEGVTFSYQWMRGNTPIEGATQSTYVLTSADIWPGVSVRVTATFGASSASANSASMEFPEYGFERGINISGQESSDTVGAMISNEAVDYFASKGVDTIRFTYSMERIQPVPGGPIRALYADRIKDRVNYILSKGIKVILDPHNALRFSVGATIGDNAITGGTVVLVGQSPLYTNDHVVDHLLKVHAYVPGCYVSLMNEPANNVNSDGLTVDPAKLRDTYNAAIFAIRGAGYKQVILWSGQDYGNIYAWEPDNQNRGVIFTGLVDSLNKLATDIHVYVDAYSAGQSATVSADYLAKLQQFTSYARSVGLKAMVGEFGAGSNAANISALADITNHFEMNRDVYEYGYTFWTAVQYQSGTLLQILPVELTNGSAAGPYTDRNQMLILREYFAGVDSAPKFTVNPSFSGVASVGGIGNATFGGVTGFPAPSVAYQWQWNNGGTWTDIAGATGRTYVFASGDAGRSIRRRSTASNGVAPDAVAYSDAVTVLAQTKLSATDKTSTIGLYNNDLAAYTTGSDPRPEVRATVGRTSGKFYFEVKTVGGTMSGAAHYGLVSGEYVLGNGVDGGVDGIGLNGAGTCYGNGQDRFNIGAVAADQIVRFAVDLDNKTLFISRAGGNWNNNASADPATNVGGTSIAFFGAKTVYPVLDLIFNPSVEINFGDSPFTYAAPAGFGSW